MIEIEESSSILFEYISNECSQTLSHFNTHTKEYDEIQAELKNNNCLLVPKPLSHAAVGDLTKLLILSSLTFSHRTFESMCKSCRIDQKSLHIVWNNNITSTVKPVMTPLQFTQFLKESKRALFSGLTSTLTLANVIKLTNQQFRQNVTVINKTENHLNSSIQKYEKNQLLNCEELFTIVSCCPNEVLTEIYQTLSRLFDHSIHMKTVSSSVSVKSMFEHHASNLNLNFEKLKAHFNLCFFHTDDTFKEKISNETVAIIEPIIARSENRVKILNKIKNTPQTIFKVYQQFFNGLYINTSDLIN